MTLFLAFLLSVVSAQITQDTSSAAISTTYSPWQQRPCLLSSLAIGCASVTTHKAFVGCNTTGNFLSGYCYCLPTFDGNATTANPCTCPSNKKVYFAATLIPIDDWGVQSPVCLDLPTLQGLQTAETKNQLHISYATTFLNNTIGTLPTAILATGGQPLIPILDPNVQSRISPAGTFNGFDGVVEYFYGFVANPGLRVINVNFRTITARDNFVAVKADLWLNTLNSQASGGHPPAVWNLTTFAFFTFNPATDKILSIDVSVPNLGVLLDIPANETALRQNSFVTTCGIMTQPVPGFPQYPNGTCYSFNTWGNQTDSNNVRFGRCLAFMQTVTYGTYDRANSNSYSCRQLHVTLTLFNPAVHCPHTSPSGGNACIDFAYSSYYLQDY